MTITDAAYAAHPERFSNGPPVVRRPPDSVAINPLSIGTLAPEDSATPVAPSATSTEVTPLPPSAAPRPRARAIRSRTAPAAAIPS
jgi:hypothetical protein